MSGTGQHLSPAEQHLGDRLAAFVDGELRDDARDRVLAHLVTCTGCKQAADEQRKLKSAVAEAAPPALSAALLARLQGLPGGDDDAGGGCGPLDDDVIGAASLGGERLGGGTFGGGFGSRHTEPFSLPVVSDGFRIHPVQNPSSPRSGSSARSASAPRTASPAPSTAPAGSPAPASHPHPHPQPSPSRGRRFAFAAAGAFSMAAIALGGALPLDAAMDTGSEDPGPAASPLTADATAGTSGILARPDSPAGQMVDDRPGRAALRPATTIASVSAARSLLPDAPARSSGSRSVTPSGTPSAAPSPTVGSALIAVAPSPSALGTPSASLPADSLVSLIGGPPATP